MQSDHMSKIEQVAMSDVATLTQKERTYGGSWKKRGGVGAFMMLARKMDRIENIAQQHSYDVFSAVAAGGMEGEDGSMIAEIRDLRCYLNLVEAEMLTRFGPTIVDFIPPMSEVTADEGVVAGAKIQPQGMEHPSPFGYSEKDEIGFEPKHEYSVRNVKILISDVVPGAEMKTMVTGHTPHCDQEVEKDEN